MNIVKLDQQIRLQALNPEQSFIVQAPAGSGKTELLTQRYLKLLTHAKKAPEEIIAITFTRKAAAEMRQRVLGALNMANEDKPTQEHRQLTWELARAVLQKEQAQNWQLQQNPNRLRILTIDALASYLAAQIPMLSRFGAQPNIIDDPQPLYEEAAMRMFATAFSHPEWSQALTGLLLHLDNKVSTLQNLLTQMLAKREQWLPYIAGHHQQPDALRELLETGLQNIALEKMQSLHSNLPEELITNLLPIAHAAASHLDKTHLISQLSEIDTLPEPALETLPYWQAIAELLLTQQDQWRKTIDKRQGFPAKSEHKLAMQSLLSCLQQDETLRLKLVNVRHCPPLEYSTEQWQIIEALLHLLPLLTAQLNIIFQEREAVDFIELNLAALRALGDEDSPTDLALYLDYQVQHILVDEFQDTSVMQYSLLEKLIAGWQPDDGRSIFLVGDPMQSIYRFRNAEVGLFLRAQQHGIGCIDLNNLALRLNFRSQQPIVEWVNNSFSHIFPTTADIAAGAVPFSDAHPTQLPQNSEIRFHGLAEDDFNGEAQRTLSIIQTIMQNNPNQTIAILVRSRTQLHDIMPTLRAANLAFQAVEIESLAHQTVIQDLLSLTRALLHRADRISWLAILRAPWCGLTLADLHALCQHDKPMLYEALLDFANIDSLSKDGKQRLARITAILAQAQHNIGLKPLSQIIHGTWVALGGPACLSTWQDTQHVQAYIQLLEHLETEYDHLYLSLLEEKLYSLYAKPESHSDAKIQIMTIHKSKGLEFDHVILPNLERQTPNDKNRLLMWLERPTEFGSNDLILALIKAAHENTDAIYTYLRQAEKDKLNYETARLLYVAATRAKASLHLISTIKDAWIEDDKSPSKGSFLALLWKIHQADFIQSIQKSKTKDEVTLQDNDSVLLQRLSANWTLPKLANGIDPQPIMDNTPINPSPSMVDININMQAQRHVGTLIHELLETIAKQSLIRWQEQDLQEWRGHWQMRLLSLGVLEQDLTAGIEAVQQAIHTTLQSERGQWILENKHEDIQNEYAVSAKIDDKVVHAIIDRTFIDSTGTRWIIDYKSSSPHDEELTQFIAKEKAKYQAQLTTYAQILHELDPDRPIKLGLYFPVCDAWHEWRYNAPSIVESSHA